MAEIEKKRISELPTAAELTGSELLVAEQDGVAVQMSAADLAGLVSQRLPTYSGTVEVS